MPVESAMYELLEHTADVRVRLWAPDLAGLYAAAVEMMRHVLVGRSRVEERTVVELAVGGDDPGERFFRFVRELVYLHDVDRFVPCGLAGMDPLAVRGEAYDPVRHTFEHAPKAVTRHGFAFEAGEGGCRAELVMDL